MSCFPQIKGDKMIKFDGTRCPACRACQPRNLKAKCQGKMSRQNWQLLRTTPKESSEEIDEKNSRSISKSGRINRSIARDCPVKNPRRHSRTRSLYDRRSGRKHTRTALQSDFRPRLALGQNSRFLGRRTLRSPRTSGQQSKKGAPRVARSSKYPRQQHPPHAHRRRRPRSRRLSVPTRIAAVLQSIRWRVSCFRHHSIGHRGRRPHRLSISRHSSLASPRGPSNCRQQRRSTPHHLYSSLNQPRPVRHLHGRRSQQTTRLGSNFCPRSRRNDLSSQTRSTIRRTLVAARCGCWLLRKIADRSDRVPTQSAVSPTQEGPSPPTSRRQLSS